MSKELPRKLLLIMHLISLVNFDRPVTNVAKLRLHSDFGVKINPKHAI